MSTVSWWIRRYMILAETQQALDMLVLYDGTQQVTSDTIMSAVDYDPLPTLEAMGLSVVESEEVV